MFQASKYAGRILTPMQWLSGRLRFKAGTSQVQELALTSPQHQWRPPVRSAVEIARQPALWLDKSDPKRPGVTE